MKPSLKLPIARPLTVIGAPTRFMPGLKPPVPVPRTSIMMIALEPVASVFGADPGWVYPSMIIGTKMIGDALASWMRCGPAPGC